jgi:hypothetical protein
MIREHDIHFEFQASDVEAELRALRAEIESTLNTNGGYIPPIANGYALDKSSSVSTVRSSSSSSTVNSTFVSFCDSVIYSCILLLIRCFKIVLHRTCDSIAIEK